MVQNINGIYFIFDKETSILFSSFLTLGVLEVVLGIIMLRNPDIVKTLFPIVVGIVMITKSSLDLRLSLLLLDTFDSSMTKFELFE